MHIQVQSTRDVLSSPTGGGCGTAPIGEILALLVANNVHKGARTTFVVLIKHRDQAPIFERC
jgi:hypothetical protein